MVIDWIFDSIGSHTFKVRCIRPYHTGIYCRKRAKKKRWAQQTGNTYKTLKLKEVKLELNSANLPEYIDRYE
jgi:hypothetical protein